MGFALTSAAAGAMFGGMATQSYAGAAASAAATWLFVNELESKKVGDLIFYKNYKNAASWPNKIKTKSTTIKWSSYATVSNVLPAKCNSERFYLDNLRYSRLVKSKLSLLSSFLAKRVEKEPRCMKWGDLKKGSLIIGSMGQGKTEFLNNLITQWNDTARKMVVHDTKGEFTAYFYRKDKDYIINHLDVRGCYWDFFADNENGLPFSLISEFFNNYFTAIAGDQGDKFWQEMAGKRFREIFEELKLRHDIDTGQKIELLVEKLAEYLVMAQQSGNKTEQSIATTLEISLDIFIKFAYMAKNGRKKLLLTEFFASKDSRMFLHTIEAVAKENEPFLTALLSVMFRYQLSFFDKADEDDWVLYILDEYLTFFEKMNEDIRRSVHTKARSYGMLLLPALQYIPADDKIREVLLGSLENLFVFAITDTKTIETVQQLIGKERHNTIANRAQNKFQETEIDEKNEYLLDENVLKALKTGLHITYLPKKSLLYMGYTKLADVSEVDKHVMLETYHDEQDFIRYKRRLFERVEEDVRNGAAQDLDTAKNKLFA